MATNTTPTRDSLVRTGQQALVSTAVSAGTLAGGLGVAWALELVDLVVLHGWLDGFGIVPRSLSGLLGIPLAPFLHGSIGHLVANTIGFVLLGGVVMLTGRNRFLAVSVVSAVVSGLGVWLFGWAGTVTVGASGVIYGYLGYLLLWGYYKRNLFAFVGSIVTAVLFGGLLWGMFPMFAGAAVSWQAHLFGFVGGGLAARLLAASPRKR